VADVATYQVSETPTPYTKPTRPKVEGPQDVFDLCKHIAARRQEEVHVLLVNARHHLIKRSLVVRVQFARTTDICSAIFFGPY
jgi:DNA repair protein RadC